MVSKTGSRTDLDSSRRPPFLRLSSSEEESAGRLHAIKTPESRSPMVDNLRLLIRYFRSEKPFWITPLILAFLVLGLILPVTQVISPVLYALF